MGWGFLAGTAASVEAAAICEQLRSGLSWSINLGLVEGHVAGLTTPESSGTLGAGVSPWAGRNPQFGHDSAVFQLADLQLWRDGA
jgi:hypothetical protein